METGLLWSEYSELLNLLHKTTYERYDYEK
jgi:hypothetical protein